MYALPLADGSADSVIIHQVLHYAHSPAAAIAEAARVLAPGGTLLVVDFAAHEREELRDPRRAHPARLRRRGDGRLVRRGRARGRPCRASRRRRADRHLVARRQSPAERAAEGGMNRAATRGLDRHQPLFAEARGDIARQLRILPAQDREDGRDAVGSRSRRSRRLRAALRLGHLWRRRLDPRADPRDGRADRRARPR